MTCHKSWRNEELFQKNNVIPGFPEKSRLYSVVMQDRMPKSPLSEEGLPQPVVPLSLEEKEMIRLYIQSLKPKSQILPPTYYCRAGQVRLEFKPHPEFSSLIIRDARSGEFYYDGIVSETMDENNRVKLRFETRSRDFLELQFKSSELALGAETIFGFVRGWSGLGFLNQSIHCAKSP